MVDPAMRFAHVRFLIAAVRFAPSVLFARLSIFARAVPGNFLRFVRERNYMKTITAALHAVRRLLSGSIALVLLLSMMVLMPGLQRIAQEKPTAEFYRSS